MLGGVRDPPVEPPAFEGRYPPEAFAYRRRIADVAAQVNRPAAATGGWRCGRVEGRKFDTVLDGHLGTGERMIPVPPMKRTLSCSRSQT